MFRLVGGLDAVLFNVNKAITATISWISCLNINASYWSVAVSRYGIPFFRENCLLVGNKLCLLAVTSIHGMCVACRYSNYCNVCRIVARRDESLLSAYRHPCVLRGMRGMQGLQHMVETFCYWSRIYPGDIPADSADVPKHTLSRWSSSNLIAV